MAKIRLELGAELDVLTKDELDRSLKNHAGELDGLARAVKYRRLPPLSGTASGGVLDIGGDAGAGVTWPGNPVGPAQSWAWEIGLLSVTGLTGGATPDVVNLYIQGAGSAYQWWQFNGNSFAYTFGGGELVLLAGESLRLASVGTFAATGRVTLIGSIRSQTPMQKLGLVTAI
jgi:hypothetical protein